MYVEYIVLEKITGVPVVMLHMPDKGIPGNSHMMMDKNNLQVADRLLDWINDPSKK